METQSLDSTLYYQHMFKGFMSKREMTEFIVIDIDTPEFDPNETKAIRRENFRCVQVELKRVSDIGKNEDSYLVNTHLGEVLNYNDSVMCYDLVNANFSEQITEELDNMKKDYPDVVVVKKHYPRMRRKHRKRYWKLDRIPVQNDAGFEEDMDADEEEEKFQKKPKKSKKSKKKSKLDQDHEREFEEFLQEIEEDPELRSTMNLYKDKLVMDELEMKLANMGLEEKTKEISETNKLVKKKKIVKAKRKTEKGQKLQQETQFNDKKTKQLMKAIKDEDESDVEEDFPAVNIAEMMDNLNLED